MLNVSHLPPDRATGGLIDRGLLDRLHQDDPDQVQGALHAFLDQTLASVVSHG
jgi:hypothetical protein